MQREAAKTPLVTVFAHKENQRTLGKSVRLWNFSKIMYTDG